MLIALLAPEQYESTVDLLCELHAYYNEPAVISREVVRDHLLGNLLAVDSPFRLVVATNEDTKVIGFAAVSLAYSLVEPAPEKRRQCALKELFVSPSQRSKGTGQALMAWVAQYAIDNACCRIDWPVNAANLRGISFYEGLGSARVAERLSYRLSGKNMVRLASETVGDAQSG
jgi:ribosomal protein S18 acetylase RimI-like enzyme